MLGHSRHTMFVRNSAQSAEAFGGVGLGHALSVYGERTRLIILWIYIAILRCSISRLFSTRFAINNDTISADNLHAYLHRWGTASSC